MNIPMQLSRIFIREMTDMQIIELSEVGGTRAFPIVIGLPEAFAIERRLKGIEIPRPQTHDLLANTIEALGGELLRIEITNMNEGTFYARLIVSKSEHEIEIDSRPSDAIALGRVRAETQWASKRSLTDVVKESMRAKDHYANAASSATWTR